MSTTPQGEAGRLAPEIASTLAGRRFGLLGFNAEQTGRIAGVLERAGAVWARFEESWIGRSVYLGDALLIQMAAVSPRGLREAAGSGAPVLLVRLFRVLSRRPDAGRPEPRAQPLVLIADDDPAWNALVESSLRTHGLACRTVTDGLGVLRLARQLRPDLVVLDVQMPGMDGFDVLEAIRRDPVLESVPVAMLTACVDAGEVSRGSALHADDYIAKPVSPTVLVTRIRKLLAPAGACPPESASPEGPEPETAPGLDELRAVYL